MRRAIFMMLGSALLAVAACSSDNESQAVSSALSVDIQRPPFDATVFDTLTWSSKEELLARGQAVFEANCEKCHGPTGGGEEGFTYNGLSYTPPSWLVADWRFANDPIGLRQYIYSGSVGDMPYWGLAGVSYRDLDAVSNYIVNVLRPAYGEKPSTVNSR
jgi:mono/diheme cytochrome c family protein